MIHRHRCFAHALLCSALLCSLTACESDRDDDSFAPTPDPAAPALPAIAATEVHDLRSEHVGDDYRISVALPNPIDPLAPPADASTRYPVIYVLDASWGFGGTVELTRLLSPYALPSTIVVGIGYPEPQAMDIHLLRTRDFTPTRDERYGRVQDTHVLAPFVAGGGVPVLERHEMGGADRFLAFLRDELKPFIESNYPADPTDATLVASSFGGTFAVHTLLHQPETFQRYVITSPGLAWDNAIHLQHEAAYAASHDDLPARVFLAAGGLEELEQQTLARFGDDDSRALKLDLRYVERMQNLATLLQSRDYPGLSLHTRVIDGETHPTTPAFGVSIGLRTVFESQYFFSP